MSEEEIKIITLGDIFKNLETEEKAFKLRNYIVSLQQKLQQKENIIKEVREYIKEMPNDEYIGYWKKEIFEILDKENK